MMCNSSSLGCHNISLRPAAVTNSLIVYLCQFYDLLVDCQSTFLAQLFYLLHYGIHKPTIGAGFFLYSSKIKCEM